MFFSIITCTDGCNTRNLRTLSSSAAILFVRHPDVVTCVRLQISPHEVFILFNPRAASEQERVASLTFSTTLPQIVERLRDIFPMEKIQLTPGNLDRQAKLLEKCAVHVFAPRATAQDSRTGEDCLVVSSLTLLSLKAELEELTRGNGALKREKQHLEKRVVDLGAQLEEEKAKTKRTQSFRPSGARTTTHRTSAFRGPQLSQSSHSTGKGKDFRDTEVDVDPSVRFALQLQASFDSENELLLKQKHELMQTAQRQYHCGVCLDDFPEDDAVRIDACGHEICRDCALGHVRSKIEEHRFPVLCPVCTADNQNQNPGSASRDCALESATYVYRAQSYRVPWCSCSASPRNSGRPG